MKFKKNESFNMKGIYHLTSAYIQTDEQWKITEQIDKLREQGKEFMSLVRKLNSICKVDRKVIENILPTVGRTMIANNLVSTTPTNEMIVEYIAVGSDNTAVADGDTTLGTETYRNAVASKTNSTNTAYVSGFFNATEYSGTIYEAGIFSDATATTDSGILVSHVLVDAPTGVVKTNTTTLTIDWTITIS